MKEKYEIESLGTMTMDDMPLWPIKNEDGTYTIKFPNVILTNEKYALLKQTEVFEFLMRWFGGTPQYIPRHNGSIDMKEIIEMSKKENKNRNKMWEVLCEDKSLFTQNKEA